MCQTFTYQNMKVCALAKHQYYRTTPSIARCKEFQEEQCDYCDAIYRGLIKYLAVEIEKSKRLRFFVRPKSVSRRSFSLFSPTTLRLVLASSRQLSFWQTNKVVNLLMRPGAVKSYSSAPAFGITAKLINFIYAGEGKSIFHFIRQRRIRKSPLSSWQNTRFVSLPWRT